MENVGILIATLAVGLFTISGALTNWPWFMDSSRSRVWVRMLGVNGARAAYIVIGLLIIATGIYASLR